MTSNAAGSHEVRTRDALILRVMSAAIMVPAGIALVWTGGIVLQVAALICGLGMWTEYHHTVNPNRKSLIVWIFGGLCLIAASFILPVSTQTDWIALVGLIGTYTLYLVSFSRIRAIWLIAGVVVIGAAFNSLVFIRNETDNGLIMALIIMVCVWATDISAYFAGRGFGGPQLSPQNSPNKTWSGAAAALICTVLIGALLAGLFSVSIIGWMAFASAISLIGQLGDYLQSVWKRRFKVKDSGRLIPGHGGLLDRLDAFSAVLIVYAATVTVYPSFPNSVLGLEMS